jgi:TonB family protein
VLKTAAVIAVCLAPIGCVSEPGRLFGQTAAPVPVVVDALPQMQNSRTPFEYPESAWSQRIQGNVMLRLYVDATGRCLPESTRVATTSGVPVLDSAALAGATALRFRPAQKYGAPVAVSLLFPVHFRHPDGPPFPGDSSAR